MAALLLVVAVQWPIDTGVGRTPASEAPLRILIVGDSVTQGSAGDWTWRYRLWRHLDGAAPPVDFVGPRDDLFDNVAGMAGSHDYLDPGFDADHAARWGMAFFLQELPISDLVETFEPDVVVEMLGANDLTWGAESPADTLDRLEDFVDEARAADPSLSFVLSEVPQTWLNGVTEFNSLLAAEAPSLDLPDSPVAVAAASGGFTLVDDTWDTAHANANGEVKLAAAVADALAVLGVGVPYPRPLPDLPLGPRRPPVLQGRACDGFVSLSWTGPPGADGEYVWTKDLVTGGDWSRSPAAVTGYTWLSEGLENGHTYGFRLQPTKGFHAADEDAWSDPLELTPRPDPPTVTSGSVSRAGVAHLEWVAPVPGDRYVVQMRRADRGRWTVAATPRTPSAEVRGLVPLVSYSFRVLVERAGVASLPSEAYSLTAPRPGPVSGVVATSPRGGVVRAHGSGVPEATSYTLRAAFSRTCRGLPPGTLRLVESGLKRPRARMVTSASHLWIRFTSVRLGIASGAGPTSTTCLRVTRHR